MTALNERIFLFRKDKCLNQKDFSKIIGISRSSLSEIESGKTRPSSDLVVGIATKFKEINNDWLLTGQGEMYKVSEKQDMKIVKMAELMEGLDAAQRQEILSAIAEKQQLNEMKHQLKQLTTDWQKCKSA